ncbi:unnamed protein product, partial [Ceratitis capitata]
FQTQLFHQQKNRDCFEFPCLLGLPLPLPAKRIPLPHLLSGKSSINMPPRLVQACTLEWHT